MDHSIAIPELELTVSMNSTVKNQTTVNMAPWAARLTTRVEDESTNWNFPNPSHNEVPNQKASIFKRSNNGDEDLYKDRAILLGPYNINHYKSEQIQGLMYPESEKRDAAMVGAKVGVLNFTKFICWLSTRINEVRACYADPFEMDDEKFAEVLLIDAFCIICMITTLSQGPEYPKLHKQQMEDFNQQTITNICNHHIMKTNKEARKIMADVLMLENQIPFSVVNYLWENCYQIDIWQGISFKDVALSCFGDFYPRGVESRDTNTFNCLHLLDLFHWSCMPIDRFRDRATYIQPILYIPNATELQTSSVIFEKRESDCFLDINFCKRNLKTRGVISIPKIHLYGYSRSIIQNLVAFEQGYELRGYGFTAYVDCMAQLVQTEKDVSILRSSGIIASSTMTDREVIDFYKTIRDGVQVDKIPPDDLYKLYEQVKNHIENRPRFPNIWIPISVASVSILVLTFIQTFYSMLGYYTPRH
ncbi:UPF0481 protein At3g47200-like [Carex rostrata]